MVEVIQYGGGISSIRWKIFNTDVSHHQYGGGASDTAQGVVGGCIYRGK